MKYDDDILRIIEKIGGHISVPAHEIPKPKREITLTPLALRLLARNDAEQVEQNLIKRSESWNHVAPQRKVRKIGEATGRTHFDRAERDYHGYEKPLEIATGGHRVRGLDYLIKSRT
jgi:hypothetical protein